MSIISVSLPSDGTNADVSDYNTPITTIVNAINGNLDSTNIASLSGTKITAGTIPGSALDSTTAAGYITGLTAPNTVTALGNRSYSMVFNGVDYTSTLSSGMRLRTTRSVAAPTQCTNLNGTTQFYSKTSPAGMTFTDNWTQSAWIKLSNYPSGDAVIAGRFTTTGFTMVIKTTGQLQIAGVGAANRIGLTYQSVPINKWVHVAATMTMSTGTVNTYIDGVVVPNAVTGSGTSLTQAGNYEVGSSNGGTNLFPGKLAQVAIYNAVISQATILAAMHQTLAGTEPSEISAFSFNNTINDLNVSNANNLTANGSAVATNLDTPFAQTQNLTGITTGTVNYAIIQSVTFSTNTTVVVQVPEGCTIPTSGGVSALVYSSNKTPYGFPSQTGKWSLETLILSNVTAPGSTISTIYNPGGINLSVPIGAWTVGSDLSVQSNPTSTAVNAFGGISTSASSFSEPTLGDLFFQNGITASGLSVYTIRNRRDNILLATATPYFALVSAGVALNSAMILRGAASTTAPEHTRIYAENAYL